MAMQSSPPPKRYRMADGSVGNEYEAVSEAIKRLEAKKQDLEDQLEMLRIRLATAEGRPV